jgi:PAS domain S-box-containing protein
MQNLVTELDSKVALHAMMQSSAAIAFVNHEGKIIFFNAAAEQATGYTQDEVLGSDIDVVLAATFSKLPDRAIQVFLKEQSATRSISKDIEVVRKDTTTFWGNITLSRIAHNDTTYFSVLISDVTKRQKMEDDLLSKNAQLGKLNAQMEKFLYSTSHDLRSPLTSIMGLVNLMRMESIDQTLQEYIAKIEQSTMKLDRIIRNIMNFSKATYQRRRSEKIDLEYLAHRVLNAHQGDPNFRRIHFEVVASQEHPFYSDPERLEIILNNTIANAIHFFDANKVRSFVRINIAVEAKEVLIEIIDNGLGIGKQHHDQIFSMFYKATLNSSGAGLGLYIVKESIEQLKGSVTMESELGFGSVFRIRVPNDHKGQLINRKIKLQKH